MCGVAGMYGPRLPTGAVDSVGGMLALIRHRGPDEAGIYLSDRLCMGTVRLSIVGVSSGQQPMLDGARYALCYNGEIYNYVELRKELSDRGYSFRTDSDTEVVLHAWSCWGPHCLQRFNGAFAFALYDRHDEILYLARDRFGKRPLFYTRHGEALLFASEMKAFLAFTDFSFRLDPEQLASIFTFWTPLADQSGYAGIRQVPVGSYLCVSDESVEMHRYFQQEFVAPFVPRTRQEAIEAIGSALRRAVTIRMRSDVEVGMYLSGGLDSSILASIVAEQVQSGFRTYSVAFADKEFDESADQQRMSAYVGSRHKALLVTDQMIVDNFPAAVFHAEVPVFRTAIVPMYLLAKMVRDDGIKVVMTGEGADEAFLGYDLFKETLLRSAWRSIGDEQKLARLRQLHPYLKHYAQSHTEDLLGLYRQFIDERYEGLFSHELRIQNGLFCRRLLRGEADAFAAIGELLRSHPYFHALAAVEKAQWLEYQTLLAGYLLSSQGDRMALGNSVENRCPYLDPDVVALSAGVNLRFDDGTDEKHLLRAAFAGRLPAENLARRKYPYRAPDSKAFVAVRPEYLELVLSRHELDRVEVLQPRFCEMLTRKILQSPADEITTKENQAFIFLLSMCLQHYQYTRRHFSGNGPIWRARDLNARVIDHRSRRGTRESAEVYGSA